ncbi:MAG TPA: IS701 family transposase [Candidatus Acidoferrum sp.]|jgi:SRSO17 transposase|nr:IS701 family transposase [Candidatus Acidoferrum sp.]
MDGLAKAAGHADRETPLKNYCTGLLLPGERKSVEPMAARLAPDNIRRMHQSLHHLVADAPWSDKEVLSQVRHSVLLALQKQGSVVCWIVDDTGFPKKGSHSVGVARQYCGQVGKQDNCRVAVSLSIATWSASLPIAFRLYLPEVWTENKKRRREGGIPDDVEFQTKPQIALEQIRDAVKEGVTRGVVVADAGYGVDGKFRTGLTELGLAYAVGVQSSLSVWAPGTEPLPPLPRKQMGRPPKLLRRDQDHQPVAVKDLALGLPPEAWKTVSWRQGTQQKLRSRFAALRVRPAHRDYWQAEPHAEEWLLIEWPKGEAEAAKYWLSTLSADVKLKDLVSVAKQRWIIERDYEELKQELGLGHYEGRGWRGFHHHATLCIAAYGFLLAERSRFPPSARAGKLELCAPAIPPGFQPRGSARSGRAA